MEQTITIGLAQAIGMVIGIVGGISTITFALLVYFDKRNEKRIDEVKADLAEHRREVKADLAEHRREVKADLQDVQRNERTLTSKVDRIQGTLDVLVFGERVPEPVAREREQVETAGDENGRSASHVASAKPMNRYSKP